MRADIRKLRRALGSPKPPKAVTQEPYDIDAGHLRRLARGDWRVELPRSDDIFEYVEDINYCEVVQPELFRYLLPVLLEIWRLDMMGECRDYGAAMEWFYRAFARRRLAKELLGTEAEQAAGNFVSGAILDRVDREGSLTNAANAVSASQWIGALAGFGAIFPAIESFWEAWWRLETFGQARAVLQYSSELIWEFDNPVFPLWVSEEGPQAPCLWEPAGFVFDRWLPENVEYLRRRMTPDVVEGAVRSAVSVLRGHEPDAMLDRIVGELAGQRSVLERRIGQLVIILSSNIDEYLGWDDVGN